MIKKITHTLLARHHFWRYASFTELNELYVSNMLRAVAGGLFGIFIPVYMLQSGYSLTAVCMYYVLYFVVRGFSDLLSAHIVGAIGPKHTWILSHLSSIASLACLLGIGSAQWLFWLSAVFSAFCTSFLYIPLHVDFSKVKSTEHNGKEQSFFMMLEKVGKATGPLLGGYIAATYGANFTIIASIILFTLSLIPLLSTPEQVATHQKVTFKGFPYKKVWRDIVSNGAQGIDATVTNGMWPVFMSLAIFTTASYEKIGLASTVSLLVALFITYIFGRVLDGKRPLLLLRVTTILDTGVYVGRVFANSLGSVIGVNVANETAFSGIWMAAAKGKYAAVDDLPGYRVAYFTVLELTSQFMKCCIWLLLALLTLFVSDISALQICFGVTGVLVLGIMIERYKVLRPRTSWRLLQ